MAGNPLFMRDVSLTLTIGAEPALEVNCDVHTVEVAVEPGDVVTYQTLCADGSFSEPGRSSYALHITAAQDWGADGLARVLWEHEGEAAEFRYQAHGSDVAGADAPSDATPGMMGEVRLIAPTYGGEADTFAELDVTLPCTSKPELLAAAFPAGTRYGAGADTPTEDESEPMPATEDEPELVGAV
jgi:hypothetical protein